MVSFMIWNKLNN